MVSAPPKPNDPTGDRHGPNIPPTRGYSQRGGRPGLNVGFRRFVTPSKTQKTEAGRPWKMWQGASEYPAGGFGNGSTRGSRRSTERYASRFRARRQAKDRAPWSTQELAGRAWRRAVHLEAPSGTPEPPALADGLGKRSQGYLLTPG